MEENEKKRLEKIINDLETLKIPNEIIILRLKRIPDGSVSNDLRKTWALEKIAEELQKIRIDGIGQEKGC